MCDVSNKQVYYVSTVCFNNTPDEERVLGLMFVGQCIIVITEE